MVLVAVKWNKTRSVFKGYNFCLACCFSKVNHNFEILDLISMKGTDHDDAGQPEQAHSKALDFQPLSRQNLPQEIVKFWFVKSYCCFVFFFVSYSVSRVVYVGVIVLFLRIPAFGYSLQPEITPTDKGSSLAKLQCTTSLKFHSTSQQSK